MPWRPLPRIAFAVAIYPFQPSLPADLPLELGDELYIIEEGGRDGSWYRGYLVAPPSLLAGLTSVKGQTLEARVFSGIFPKRFVEVREVLGDIGADGSNPDGDGINGSSENSNRGIDKPSLSAMHNDVSGSKNNEIGSVRRKTSRSHGIKTERSSKKRNASPHLVQKGPGNSEEESEGHELPYQSTTSYKINGATLPLTPVSMSPKESNVPRPPAPVPMLKIGDETPTSSSEPLVDEVASCLREWHSTNLHELLLSRQYDVLEELAGLSHQVDLARRQLLHGVLTGQELTKLREKTVWDLVRGNKMLSDEVIVRDPKQRGRLLTGDDSVIEISRLQSTMSLLEGPPLSFHDQINLYHLMVEFEGLGNHDKHSHSVVLYLCSKSPGEPPKPLTEAFAIEIPPDDQLEKAKLSGNLRTLFTDLSPGDIGENSGSNIQLYLVIKVQSNELAQQPVPVPPRATPTRELHSPSPSLEPNGRLGSSAKKGGRRSLMWAQSKFAGSNRSRDQQSRALGQSLGSLDSTPSLEFSSRPNTPNPPRPPTQQGPQNVKKDIGVAVLQLRHIFHHDKDLYQTLTVWSSTGTSSDARQMGDKCEELVQDLISSSTRRYAQSGNVDGVHVRLRSFNSPNAGALITKTPTLLHNIPETPKIGFSGVPTKTRSDIYLTLINASIPTHSLYAHPERGNVPLSTSLDMRNIQLTLEVRKGTGERIERCIFPSSNSNGHTAWRTTVVERGEAWNQTIKLVIPNEDVPDAHLIMSIADAPGFPFALSWMPLWDQQAFIKDGIHKPLLYLYDKITSRTEMGRGAYLSFPWTSTPDGDRSKIDKSPGSVSRLIIESYLCSTVFSQNQVLLGILKWREQTEVQLLTLLKQLIFVPEIEVVKVVSDVFDALFGILVERSGNDEFEDLVFNALVTVLGIVHDRRFNLGPLVKEYAENRFSHPFATPCLIRSYLRLISHPAESRNSRNLRATFKVGRQILKFIVEARKQQKIKEAGIGITSTQSSFNREIRSIFVALESLMKDPSPSTIGSKTIVVQHIHTWLSELNECFAQEEVLEVVSSFLDACSDVSGKLILHKLILILHLSRTMVLEPSDHRQEFDGKIANWIAPYWGSTDEVTEQWREQIRLCCSIVTSQTGVSGSHTFGYFIKTVRTYQCLQSAVRPPKRNLSLLFPESYPFPSKPTSKEVAFDENLIELGALLAYLLDNMAVENFRMQGSELVNLLSAVLQVDMSILDGEGFPSSWLTLHVYHHRTIYYMLENIFSIMIERFLPSPDDAVQFNTELWRTYFTALLKLVHSQALALETFPEQKRRAVWKIAGDVREQGADLLQRSWDAIGWETSTAEQSQYGLYRLGGYQVQYVPSLVAPTIELCLSVHEGLRRVAVGIVQSMIVSEWELNEDLSVIQAEMIECLDQLFKSRDIAESAQQKLFMGELLNLFEPILHSPDNHLSSALKVLLSTIEDLIDLLVDVHTADATEASQIMSTLRLMDFLKDVNKDNIFIRYVHQLSDLQAQSRNATEAGLALRLHADLYSWDPTLIVSSLSNPDFPEQSAFDRKECLYFEMIKLFEEGTAWNCALASYHEIAAQYEKSVFDFAKLARTQRAMATIYETIAKGEDKPPRYFRVIYRGLGFPSSLRDKQFIYQGSGLERLATFTDRLLQQHPTAQVVPLGYIDNVEGQFLQIAPVNPLRDLKHPVFQRTKVPQAIREFLLSSEPIQFAITSRRHSPKSGLKDQWVEKTVYTTAESFPNILRRSEIVSADVVPLSPLQTAVERTTRKTSELITLEKSIVDGNEMSFSTLTDAIRASVDPSSATSVAQYRDLLPQPIHSDDEDSIASEAPPKPLEIALKAALLDHVTKLRHCIALYSRPAYEATQFVFASQLSSTFAPEVALLAPPSRPRPTSPQGASWPQPYITPSSNSFRYPSLTVPNAPHSLTNGNHHSSTPSQRSQITTSTPEAEHQSPGSRNRFSLSFLKRNNIVDSQASTNGVSSTPNHLQPPDEDSYSISSNQSKSKPRQNSHVSWRGSEVDDAPNESVTNGSGRKNSDYRPFTSTSSVGTASTGEKGVAATKRFSMLGVGKKESFKGGGVDSVREE